MKSRTVKILSVVLALALCSTAQTIEKTELPFTSVRSMLLVSVTVDGKPCTLIFDTGSEHTMIQDTRNVLHVAQIILGTRTLPNVPVAFISFAGSMQGEALAATKADGILGQDVMRTFGAISIDYSRKVITLEARHE